MYKIEFSFFEAIISLTVVLDALHEAIEKIVKTEGRNIETREEKISQRGEEP
jgi:hypothetical protein